MIDNWQDVDLESIGAVITGRTPSTVRSEYFGGDIPFITPTDMNGRRIISTTERYLSEEGKDAVAKAVIPSGAIVVSCIGSDMGKAAIAAHAAVTNQQINSLIVSEPNSALFVYYNLSSRREEIRGMAAGSAQPILNKSSFSRLRLRLPPPDEQRAIADVLGSLDDKIEQNRRTGAKLEGLARAVFKAWFVDFEPVKAKAAGATAFPGMPPETFAALPTRLEDSELGPVPEGWRVRPASEVTQRLGVGKKFDQKTVKSNGKIPVLDQSAAGIIGYHDESPGVQASIDNPVATFANHTCNMRLLHYPFSTIQNVLPFVGNGVDTLWVYFGLLGRQKFIEYKGHWPDFMILQLVMPTESLSECFVDSIRPLIKLIWMLDAESAKLATLRDYLLPRLLSGRVRVRGEIT